MGISAGAKIPVRFPGVASPPSTSAFPCAKYKGLINAALFEEYSTALFTPKRLPALLRLLCAELQLALPAAKLLIGIFCGESAPTPVASERSKWPRVWPRKIGAYPGAMYAPPLERLDAPRAPAIGLGFERQPMAALIPADSAAISTFRTTPIGASLRQRRLAFDAVFDHSWSFIA